MNDLPFELYTEIASNLSCTDLLRWSKTNTTFYLLMMDIVERRLQKTSIRVVTFISYYIEDEVTKEEIICKIFLGPVTKAERDSLVNESNVIQCTGNKKFATKAPTHKFNRVEISETILGTDVGASTLLPILLGREPLILAHSQRLTPFIPFFKPLSATKKYKSYIVKPSIGYREGEVGRERPEKNIVVYYLAFDTDSEFFTTVGL